MSDQAKIIFKGEDQVTDVSKKVQKSFKEAADQFKKVGAGLTAIGAAATLAIKDWTESFIVQERAEKRIEQLTRQTVGATDEQIQSLKDLASAQQEIGVIGDEVTIFGQSQLATFALQTESIEALTPAMLDLAVANKGANVTQEDMITIGNLMGKVLTGQVGALTKYGVSFTDAQEEMLKFGTEQEKAATLAEVLTQNFGGLNAAMRDTTEGGLVAASNAWGDFKEQMGQAVAPAILFIAQQIEKLVAVLQGLDADTKKFIGMATLLAAAFGLIGGPLLVLIGLFPTIVAGFTAIGTVAGVMWAAVTGPIGLAIAAILAVVATITLLVKNWEWVKEKASEIWNYITDVMSGNFQLMSEKASQAWDAIYNSITGNLTLIKDLIIAAFNGLKDFLGVTLDAIVEGFDLTFKKLYITATTYLRNLYNSVKSLFQQIGTFMVTFITDTLNTLLAVLIETFNSIKEFITSIWTFISDTFMTGVTLISDIFVGGLNSLIEYVQGTVGVFENAFSLVWNAISGVIQKGIGSVKDMVSGMLNWFIDKINAVINGLNSVAQKASSIVPGFDAPSISNIPALAEGGIVTRPTLALVGEAGPEAVIPLSKANSGGAGNNTFIFQGPVSSKEVAMEYANLITRDLQLSTAIV